jgi:hypothetical protein
MGIFKLTGRELVKIGKKMYGDRGWQTALATALQIDTSTVRRWITSDSIPRSAALALKYLEETFDRKSL